jgi:hypothetical protein
MTFAERAPKHVSVPIIPPSAWLLPSSVGRRAEECAERDLPQLELRH